MNDRILADIRWLSDQIRTGAPAYRNATPARRYEMAKHLADLVYELDRNITNGYDGVPRDWSKK